MRNLFNRGPFLYFVTPDSKTEENSSFSWGLENLKILCSDFPHPVIAIGGINLSNMHSVLKCDVSGVAVLSAISNELSAKKDAKKLSDSILNFVRTSTKY